MIGFVDNTVRKIRPISELKSLFDFNVLEKSDPILHPDGSVEQTVEFMKKIVKDNYKTVQKLADKLYNPRLNRYLKNIFDFVMTYVQYEKDSAFMEQLRHPLRTLQEQKGDCDCTSILIGCLLYCKNIPFNFRITKYSDSADSSKFSHVYVIVPNNHNGYTVVDTVIKSFDKEKPYSVKKDFYVNSQLSGLFGLSGMPIQYLNGFGNLSGIPLSGLYGEIMQVAIGTDLFGFGLAGIEDDEAAMYNYLVRTRDVILAKPQMFKVMKNPLEVARMLDYAIRYWDTENIDNVLDILDNEEQRLLKSGEIVYPTADLSGDELGDLGFFKKVKKAVKKVAKKVGSGVKKAAKAIGTGVKKAVKATGKAVATAAKKTGQAIAKGAKAVGKGVATAAKAVAKAVARFNPVSLAARGGLLLAIKKNMFKLADKLQWGLYTEAQAQSAGYDLNQFSQLKESYNKSKKLFVNTLKGKENKFDDAIRKGVKNKAINGLGELGELGAATAAIVTAALGFITSIIRFFAGKKNPQTGEEYTDEQVNEGEVQDLMDEAEMYDEDGNLIENVNTTVNPQAENLNFWQKAGKVVNTVTSAIPQFIPGFQNPQSYPGDEEYEYEDEDMSVPQKQTTVTIQPASAMSSIGTFVKNNALMIGVGALGIAAAIYFLRKKPKGGLSGLPKTTQRKRTVKSKLKILKLS